MYHVNKIVHIVINNIAYYHWNLESEVLGEIILQIKIILLFLNHLYLSFLKYFIYTTKLACYESRGSHYRRPMLRNT